MAKGVKKEGVNQGVGVNRLRRNKGEINPAIRYALSTTLRDR